MAAKQTLVETTECTQ